MLISCPKCGAEISVAYKGGRKRLNLPVKNILDALHDSYTVTEAAERLKCSRGYLYRILKVQGISPKALTKGVHSVKDCKEKARNLA